MHATGEVISKATKSDKDAYSGFEGNDLGDRLMGQGVRRVFVGGLATDYCVFNTVRDAIKRGLHVILLTDAIRAVNIQPDDGAKAEREMQRQGVEPTHYERLGA